MNHGNSIGSILGSLDVSRKAEIRRGQPRLPISAEVMANLEREFGYPVPDDYREFLSEFGGLTVYNVPLPTSRKSLRVFGPKSELASYALHNLSLYGMYAPDPAGHWHSQDLRWRLAELGPVLPQGYFPVAQHLQDRTVCISCCPDGYGEVYLHYAEDAEVVASDPASLEADGTVKPEALCVRLAPSFTDFLASLRSASDDEVSAHFKMLSSLVDNN